MSRRARLALLIVLGCAAVAPAPEAAAPSLFQSTTTSPQSSPSPQAGHAAIGLHGGLSARRLRSVFRGQKLVVTGSVRPFVPGQTLFVEVLRRGKVVSRQRVAIR